MKKIVWLIVLALVILGAGFFSWRIWYYYQKIQKGGRIELTGQAHFTSLANGKGAAVKGLMDASKLLRPGAPELGNPQAKLVIVEFVDFVCSFSREEFPVIRELLTKYPDKIRFIFRFFPLGDETHQGGAEAAEAALCAQEQGKFWEYHDKLFQNQKNFTAEDLINLAQQVGVDEIKFNQCLKSKKYQATVRQDFQDGYSLGLAGTPTFFINGQKAEGAIPLEAWEKVVKGIKQ